MKSEIRRQKARNEIRNPKAEIRKKPEARNPNPKASRQASGCNAVEERKKNDLCGGFRVRISGFGFRLSLLTTTVQVTAALSSFRLRISTFVFGP